MNWAKSISWYEIGYIIVFLLLYAYYFWRTFNMGKSVGKPSRLRYIKFVLRSIYLGLFIIALLGPSFGISETEARTTSKDIILAVDLSSSMNTSDVSPSRLEKTKLELNHLVEVLNENRIGMLVFGSQAYWQVPLTFDTDVIKEYIKTLNTNQLPLEGTNINAPLEMIADKFEELKGQNRSAMAIVITDGESFSEVAEELTLRLNRIGADLILVGTGTSEGGEVEINNQPVILEDGSFARSSLDSLGLRKVSNLLNAELMFMQNEKNDFALIPERINQVGKNTGDKRKLLVSNNKYFSFLIAAIILASIDFLFRIKTFEI